MLTNAKITYYHKSNDDEKKLTTWTRYLIENVWVFGGKGANVNRGYENSNNVEVRIPLVKIENKNIEFSIGDIIAIGEQPDIDKQSDLNGKEFYNVTSVNINNFGNSKHVHLGGK